MPLDTASKNDSIHSTAEGERNMLIWLQSISEDARQLYNELASHNSKDYNNDDFSSMSEREGGEMGIKNSVGSAIEEELQDIVTALLACCHPNVVPMAYHCLVSYEHIRDKALTVGHFPDHSCSYEYIPLDTPLGKDTWESKVWVQLRLLLSRLAPISSYVAVQVVCTIQRRLAGSTIITSNTETYSVATATQQGILLFSHWLPDIAPHLHPIVEDFFRSIPQHVWDTLSIEIRSNSNSKNNFISLAEGMLDIFQYYTYKRCDGVHLKKWCNWSWIFDLLEHHQNLTKLQLSNHTTNDNDNHRNGNNSNSQTKGNSTADTSLLSFAGIDTTTMDIADVPEVDTICFGFQYCPSWYSARLIATLLELLPPQRLEYFQQLDEAVHGNNSQLNYITKLDIPYWFQTMKLNACDVVTQSLTTTFVPPQPDPIPIVKILSPYSHPYLVSIGPGILQYVCGSLLSRASSFPSTQPQTIAPINSAQSTKPLSLVPTPTTERNLQKLGFALCIDPPPPILVCGPRGSGKSALVRELSQRMCCMEGGMSTCSRSASNLLELHLDDETDSKTLLGSMVATETPGEFVWKPGSLTLAVEQGRWVLMEDVDKAPPELLAALKPLFEDRILPYHATRKRIKAHPNFRFFGTCSMKPSSYKDATRYPRRIPGPNRMLISEIWRKVHVDGLPYQELADIVAHRFPMLPPCITESCLNTFHAFDRVSTHNGQLHSSMITSTNVNELPNDNISNNYAESSLSKSTMVEIIDNFLAESRKITNFINSVIRTVSIRDLMKLCQRIEAGNIFVDHTTTFVPESQRILCLAEAVDVFVSSAACRRTRVACVEKICAPIWKISSSLAVQYVEARKLEWQIKESRITLGRATITTVQGDVTGTINHLSSGICSNFFDTNHSLRLMESISVCIAQNEPILLVGETGVGKTVIIQRLASMSGTHLVVQNMSLQTDSTDLLGGYRPVEIRQSARKMYKTFMEMFVSTFSRNQNTEFLNYVTAAYEKSQWKKLSQCFHRASLMGMNKIKQLEASKSSEKNLDDSKRRIILRKSWNEFHADAERFEKQRIANSSGLSFAFTEGALVDAIKTGKWVFLDEVNLASSETLQRLCGLLDDSTSSITLSERGDVEALHRHPDFRLFAAMNPATDVGKKDLPSSIRARFTEFYVDELVDPAELRAISARYLNGLMLTGSTMLENSEIVVKSVEVYLRCRELSEQVLVDSSGQRPRYTLRTLTRALSAARNFILKLGFSPQRAVLEGFELAFEGPLDEGSRSVIQKLLNSSLGKGLTKKDLDHPGRRPGGKTEANDYILVKPFWVRSGPLSPMDWAVIDGKGKTNFVLTPSASLHLRRLTRVVASSSYAVLLEGPTSAGKTTMVQYLAALCGYRCIRINNHEHTDVQEYTGTYVVDSNGSLVFQDGLLVQALRNGYWLILDELNLAPSEVLEALNRLLDDNREFFLAETSEVIKPHRDFRLFATQNPCGAYGGRKPLSRAFRNRFVEIHVGDIPASEMITILQQRCGCAPSHAVLLVEVMAKLRQRRSKSGVFRGKDGLITPRDLLRWAERGAATKDELAMEGYMLLAERLRDEDERDMVKAAVEDILKVKIDSNLIYFGDEAESRKLFTTLSNQVGGLDIAATDTLLRLFHLVNRCILQREPVLICGNTGCGKTTVIQLFHFLLGRPLHIINCHATTETSDILGGLRPIRHRTEILHDMVLKGQQLAVKYNEMLSEMPAVAIPDILFTSDVRNIGDCSADVAATVYDFSKTVLAAAHEGIQKSRCSREEAEQHSISRTRRQKRQKLCTETVADHSSSPPNKKESAYSSIEFLGFEISQLHLKYNALFEWIDGPLVTAMKEGHMILLDEINLAEDAVLERLNSVLEPSRQLTLAEKGGNTCSTIGSESNSLHIQAHNNFLIFATMNPGNDFGKRELSPALRSRFTEIWVPNGCFRNDVDLILRKLINEKFISNVALSEAMDCIRASMLDYMEWFNEEICGGQSSLYAELKLSVRDMHTWASFVREVCSKRSDISIWLAYAHGAALMHLDGLGLGTGFQLQDVSGVINAAKLFIQRQIPCDQSVLLDPFIRGATSESVYIRTGDSFGIHPFSIPLGNLGIPSNLNFSMSAPTTAMNLQRVLRAMQVSQKPIILEGSPGVGKSATIIALAAASGHRLVRINLSEQTDISDLFGSDYPVQSSNDGNENVVQKETSQAPVFKWHDGAFLSALKNGDWVLLDELNLASQSVLEGLNSCLDHRSQVFIPELGKVFDCPSTFRVFAAINPMSEGGGRKGLPKSFLNRFTKVYIEPLTAKDMFIIVTKKFPSIPSTIVETMIAFNNAVHYEAVVLRKIGHLGSPWEFNLRDIFRWCDLIISDGREIDIQFVLSFVDTLYVQRFRSKKDRDAILSMCTKCFGVQVELRSSPILNMSHRHFQVEGVMLKRQCATSVSILDAPLKTPSPSFIRHLFYPMRAVATCISMNWPCLLVGSPGSGKSTLLRILAKCCNAHLEEIALTAASDVTELIGCFEQEDAKSIENELFLILEHLRDIVCHQGNSSHYEINLPQKVWHLYWSAYTSQKVAASNVPLARNEGLTTLISQMLDILRHYSRLKESEKNMVFKASDLFDSLLQRNRNVSLLKWMDGMLVTAMEKGYWLYIDNANLCPSSVLDRLNPLMEENGKLILTECSAVGTTGSISGPKIVQVHENFRILLSTNPELGEVSRAMRNRCVEVNFLSPSELMLQQSAEVICLELLYSSGIRAVALANAITVAHANEQYVLDTVEDEKHSLNDLRECGASCSELVRRGWCAAEAAQKSFEMTHDLQEGQSVSLISDSLGNCRGAPASKYFLFNGLERTSRCAENPSYCNIGRDTRLVDLLSNNCGNVEEHFELALSPMVQHESWSNGDILESTYAKILPLCCSSISWEEIELQALVLFVRKMSFIDWLPRLALVDGQNNRASLALRVMSSLLHSTLLQSHLLQQVHNVQRNERDIFVEYCYLPFDSLETNTNVLALLNKNTPLLASVQSTIVQCSNKSSLLDIVYASRLHQFFCEQEAYKDPSSFDNESQGRFSSPIEISFAVYSGTRSLLDIRCLVTPFLYPLFSAIDDVMAQFVKAHLTLKPRHHDLKSCYDFLSRRDQFWRFLKHSMFDFKRNSDVLELDGTCFLVHFFWIRKSVEIWSKSNHYHRGLGDEISKALNRLRNLVSKISDALQVASGGEIIFDDPFRKNGAHPLVPCAMDFIEAKEKLRKLADSCSLISHFNCFSSKATQVSLESVLYTNHPFLYLSPVAKEEVLFALSTLQWASTDEMKTYLNCSQIKQSMNSLPKVLQTKLEEAGRVFSSKLKTIQIDFTIKTVENDLTINEIQSPDDSTNACNLVRSILSKFSELQISQLKQISLLFEESTIVGNILKISGGKQENLVKGLRSCLPHIKEFILKTLDNSDVCSIADLRPYQTLAWACEDESSSVEDLKKLLRHLTPLMIYHYSYHEWFNSFNDLGLISEKLTTKSIFDAANKDTALSLTSATNKQGFLLGNTYLQHSRICSILLRINGCWPKVYSSVLPHVTIENVQARLKQKQLLLDVLTSMNFDTASPDEFIIRHQFAEVLVILRNYFVDLDEFHELYSSVGNAENSCLSGRSLAWASGVARQCSFPIFRNMVDTVVQPLLQLMQNLEEFRLKSDTSFHSRSWCIKHRKLIGQAWIYIGLLRLRLSLPSSPLDPSSKPGAKCLQIRNRLTVLENTLQVRQWQSKLIDNREYPADPSSARILNEVSTLLRKLKRQEKKIAERPADAQHFRCLFQEVHHFAESIGSVSSVLDLATCLQETYAQCEAPNAKIICSREANWQSSSHAFCQRLASVYEGFEDVFVPIVNSIRSIQKGLRELVCVSSVIKQSKEETELKPVLKKLLQYPIDTQQQENSARISLMSEDVSDAIILLSTKENLGRHRRFSQSQAKAIVKRCKMAMLFSFLTRCELIFRLKRGHLDRSFFASVKIAFCELLKDSEATDLGRTGIEEIYGSPNVEMIGAEAEIEEHLHRQYFPNHSQEFLDIAQSSDSSENDGYDASPCDDRQERDGHSFDFLPSHLLLLCSLHHTFFSSRVSDVDDSCRIRFFKWSYDACSELAPVLERFGVNDSRFENVGGHVMGLAMNYAICMGALNSNVWNYSFSKPENTSLDFNNDPNPTEVIKAAPLLCQLTVRIVQLLQAFPGNAILFNVKLVAERVSQLNFDEVPVGKVLKGLELILKTAEEWEHQASRRVSIGQSLQNISSLVSKWRKLELESWSNLLDMCERHYVKRARIYWTKLYLLVNHEDLIDLDEAADSEAALKNMTPSWVCKGYCSDVKKYFVNFISFDSFCSSDKVLLDFVKIMDAFILNSSVGEFCARLQLIDSFGNQLFREYEDAPPLEKMSIKYFGRLTLSRLLGSLHKYYYQFSTAVKSFINETRTPIEKKLKEDVKLAKWDDQSYYALAESAEKSHRKLCKHLRAYGESLEAKVSTVLDNELTSDMRASKASNHGPVTKIPSLNELFPLVFAIDCHKSILYEEESAQQLSHEERKWTDIGDLPTPFDKYVINLKRYSDKMHAYISNMHVLRNSSPMRCGSTKAESFSKAIFERISRLRDTPKNVKQRALVDLFKLLKHEGFSSLKWSVPSQIRELHHVFQLPDPSNKVNKLFNDPFQFQKAEIYFQRSCAEINRLRGEITLNGSHYMTQRELSLMIGFVEHFLLVLCQQRTILFITAESLASLQEHLTQLISIDSLVSGQASLRSSVDKFNDTFTSALESCRQVLLLMMMSFNLISDAKKLASFQDLTSAFRCCIDQLDSAYSPFMVQNVFVSNSVLQSIKQVCPTIKMTEQVLVETSQKCKQNQLIPCDIFACTLGKLRSALQIAELCHSSTDTSPCAQFSESTSTRSLCDAISSLVQSILIAVQKMHKESNLPLESKAATESISLSEFDKKSGLFNSGEAETLHGYHVDFSLEWAHSNASNLAMNVQSMSIKLYSTFESQGNLSHHEYTLVGVCKDACTMASQVLEEFKNRLVDAFDFYKSYAKLTYILTRIFRTLVAKGYCSDKSEESDSSDANADGTTFEDDVEGTGMGEGVGMRDVTDQIENEEQILGLKEDLPKKKELQNHEQRQLNEDEKDKGMEMENDFDGELYDAQEQELDNDANEKSDEVELDREMGTETSPNEEIVDEKMWDEDDDQGAENQEDERFDKEGKLNGESLEGETRTKDDTVEDSNRDGKEQATRNEKESVPRSDVENEDEHGDGHINEEHGNNDEDSRPNGIEARDERSQQNNGFDDDALQDDKDMKLDEDIHLDEMDPAGESEEPDNNEDVDQNEFPDESNSHTNESEEMPDEEVKDDAENSDKAKPMGAGGDASPNYQPEEGEESVEENNSTYSVDDTSKNDLKDTAIKQKNFGVQSKNGKESINQDNDDEMEDFTENGVGSETTTGQEGQEAERGTCSGGTNDSTGSIGQGAMEQGSMDKSRAKPRLDHPNPFRSPGDADKFWHNRLEMIEDKAGDEEFDESHFEEYDEKNADPKAQPYEFTQKGQDSTTQVLGAAVEEFAHDLDMRQMEEKEDNEFLQEQKDNAKDDRQSGNIEKNESLKPALNQKDTSSIATHTESEKLNDNSLPVEGEVTNDDNDDDESNMNAELDVMSTCLSEKGDDTEVESEESEVKNKVVSDLAQLRLRQEDVEDGCELVSRYDLMEAYSHSAEDMTVDRVMEGRSKWVQLNFETLSISRRLCEKLRLVMEPLVASKLRGDYRSGKRINMKRIIGYIASGYRKDKIWLRRTKPSKRDYRVLLAVDNSESMSKTGAGGMALLALAALANGMSQLEVGELGVASFGETMRLLHPFNAPFTVESGANIACNLNFDEKRTRTALCIENVITALEHAGGGIHSSLQLVFIISDGRIERDSRSKMRRLVREMAERNMLCVMIIIENTLRDSLSSSSSTTKKQNSIMNMKEATFENGMPKLVHFMDDYPFPYYMVLEDMSSLPEVLGDALRQWFEVLAQMTG